MTISGAIKGMGIKYYTERFFLYGDQVNLPANNFVFYNSQSNSRLRSANHCFNLALKDPLTKSQALEFRIEYQNLHLWYSNRNFLLRYRITRISFRRDSHY